MARSMVAGDVFAPPTISTNGIMCGGLNDIHGDTGGARREDRIHGSGGVHFGKQFDLEIRPFRSVLLHKISVGKRASHIRRESQPIARGTRRQANPRQYTPSLLDILPESLLRIRTRVVATTS